MSVWKSPVFYFGVLLAFAVACLLAAPFVINWNAWKPEMEAYGRQLTGRDVTIDGPVEVRLFPWPRLEAREVRLANAAGFGEAPLLAANAVTLRLSLAGLFNGTLEVEEIAFDAPDMNLARNEAGAMNWSLAPEASFTGLLSRVKLDRISVQKGSIWFDDRLHGQSANLTDINAGIAAAAIEGPWRLQGDGKWRDTTVDLALTLATIEAGKPLRLSASARPQDTAMPAFVLEGDWADDKLKGKLRVVPQETTGEKSSMESAFKPLALQSDIEWALDSMRFDKIRIAPADKTDNATLIEGEASVALSNAPTAKVVLRSSRVNLDAILGAQFQQRWQRGGMLDLANGVLAGMPERLVAEFALSVDRLTLGGEALDGVNLRGVAEKQAIRIHEAVSNLPGRSRVRFDGVIFPSGGAAELGGTIAFESFDLRAFSGWTMPMWKPEIAQLWTGARGRLKLQTNVNWSLTRLAFRDAALELDGQAATAEVTWQYGEVPVLDLQLSAKALDIDSYAGRPGGLSSATIFSGLAALPPILDVGQLAEQRVSLSADTLRFNGQNASNVALVYDASLSGLQVKTFEMSVDGGTTVKGDGLVTNGQDGPLGEFAFNVTADDIRPGLRFAGLLDGGTEHRWTTLLGQTSATATIQIEPEQAKPRIAFDLAGTSGDLQFTAGGKLRETANGDDPAIDVTFEAKMPEAGRAMMALQSLDEVAPLGPLEIDGQLAGTRQLGLEGTVALRNAAAAANFSGKLWPDSAFLGAAGTMNIAAPSLKRLAEVFRIPINIDADGSLAWTTTVSVEEGALRLANRDAQAAGGAFDVSATIDGTGRIAAEVETGTLRLGQVMAAAMLPWQGEEMGLSSSFAALETSRLQGELFLKPRLLETGVGPPLQEAVIAIDATGAILSMNVKTPSRDLSFDVQMEPKGSSFAITGQGEVAIDVPTVMRQQNGEGLATGTARLQGSFNAQGQSPAAALASLAGDGTFWVDGLGLSRITIENFAENIAQATTQDALTSAFAKVLDAPGTSVGARTGNAKITGGELVLAPFGVNAGDSSVVLSPRIDLTLPAIEAAVAVSTRKRPELPPLTVTYEGAPGAIETRVANAALAAKLGYELLAQELAALEKLQQEQADILRRQEQQRKDDEDRFEAFQAQRAELRGQMRLLRFQQQERKRASAAREAAEKNAIAIGETLNLQDLQRANRLRVFQGLLPADQP